MIYDKKYFEMQIKYFKVAFSLKPTVFVDRIKNVCFWKKHMIPSSWI